MTQTGAALIARTLAENGVDTCFANPGTTEMHLLAALGQQKDIDLRLCLFEGVATGAADGYARMTGKPAATLLHLGPGLANGMANLHNARKADTPLINVVGEHATHHLAHDAPLTADINGMAATVSGSVATPQSADDAGDATAQLLSEIGNGGVATLIVPNDVAWSETEAEAPKAAPAPEAGFDAGLVDAAATALRAQGGVMIVGARYITRRMAKLAHAIGKATGCLVLSEAAVARTARGGDTPTLGRMPFHVDPATKLLAGSRSAVLVGAREPVAFFAYPNRPSRLLPDGIDVVGLCPQAGDTEAALDALAAALGAEIEDWQAEHVPEADPKGPINSESLGRVVASILPEQTIVVDESITNGIHLYPQCANAAAHDWINNRGGSIGYSMPVAVGAATACPDRKVLCITGDGSALYTLQSLWTMARHKQDITVLVLANRSYRILTNESEKIGAGAPTESTTPLMSLEDPAPNWCQLANGQGVVACSVETAGELADALKLAFETQGPRLIEVRM